MATFPAISPSYGISKSSRPNVNKIQFGSGYQQRVIFGINQNPKTWQLKWENVSDTDADTIEAFLDARAGQESFDWTPPDDATAYKFICSEWSRTIDLPTLATITATFEQVFEA